MDPAVRKETGYIAVWVVLLSLVMEAVFLLLRKWDLSVLFGNLGGAAVAIGNFFLMALIATKAMNRGVESGKPEEAAARVLLIAVFKTNVYATLIPMLFPRIGIVFWPKFNKNRGMEQAETEGSDLID